MINKNQPIKIRVNNKVVGVVEGSFFIKRVLGSKHFLRIPPAIAFDKESLRKAYNAGASLIKVIDKETKKAYFASFNELWGNGFAVDRGFGEQIALPMERWHCQDESEPFVLYGAQNHVD